MYHQLRRVSGINGDGQYCYHHYCRMTRHDTWAYLDNVIAQSPTAAREKVEAANTKLYEWENITEDC